MPGMYYLYYQSQARFHTVAVNKLGTTQKRSHFHSHNYTAVISESHPWVKRYLSQTWLHPQRRKSHPSEDNPPQRGSQLAWHKRLGLFSLFDSFLLKATLPWTSLGTWQFAYGRTSSELASQDSTRWPPNFQFHCLGNGLPCHTPT